MSEAGAVSSSLPLSVEQDRALKQIGAWLRAPSSDWEFRLGGFAGTGKTFLLQHMIARLLEKGKKKPICLAPTWKAASVLRKKLPGGISVSSIHSALYRPNTPSLAELRILEEWVLREPDNKELRQALEELQAEMAERRVEFSDKDYVDIRPGDIVIVDESSMVTAKMREDFQRPGAKVLFVGDPEQLPPVAAEGFFQKMAPHAMLTSIQRQALDSPIIRLSLAIREGKPIPSTIRQPGLRRIPSKEFFGKDYVKADQVITGMNRTRMGINSTIRRHLGFKGIYPQKNERLIVLKTDRNAGYINGIQCTCAETTRAERLEESATEVQKIGLLYEGHLRLNERLYEYPFQLYLNKNLEEKVPLEARKEIVELDFGYCITVHKSQGSEWDHVIVADDKFQQQDRNFRRRWLYTAVTRAKKELTWVML